MFKRDIVTENDSRVSDEWNSFIGDQSHWNGVSLDHRNSEFSYKR
jgi:hypothetical protein